MLYPVPITLREANRYVAEYHRHNKPPRGCKFAIGCSNGNGLVGVAIVGRPIARNLDDTFTGEVLRTCVAPDSPKNVNSCLYGACWRAWRGMGGRRLVTYTLESESGASLRGAGWKIVAQTDTGTWDRKGRAREWQPIYGQTKLRWEVTADSLSAGSGNGGAVRD